MPVAFEIKTNAMDAKYFFDSLARSQLPFALSRTINRMAWDIRDKEQARLGQYFTLRTNWLTKRGAMPVIKSSKKQFPDVHAIIGVKDEVAALAVTGGKHRPRGSDEMAVPFSNAGRGISARSILNPGKETLPKSKWPSRIVKPRRQRKTRRTGRGLKPKPFYLKGKSGRMFVALRSGVSRYPLQILYEFKRSVDVKKTWPFVENAQAHIARTFDRTLYVEIEKAIRSSRF